jgi:flavin-binding protein dodecin
MSNRTYRVTEIVGTSPDGIDQAVRNGIERASKTLRHLDWFEVTQVRGQVKDGAVEHFQVGLKVGFRLEDESSAALASAVPTKFAIACCGLTPAVESPVTSGWGYRVVISSVANREQICPHHRRQPRHRASHRRSVPGQR